MCLVAVNQQAQIKIIQNLPSKHLNQNMAFQNQGLLGQGSAGSEGGELAKRRFGGWGVQWGRKAKTTCIFIQLSSESV